MKQGDEGKGRGSRGSLGTGESRGDGQERNKRNPNGGALIVLSQGGVKGGRG